MACMFCTRCGKCGIVEAAKGALAQDRCLVCGTVFPDEARSCPSCGAPRIAPAGSRMTARGDAKGSALPGVANR